MTPQPQQQQRESRVVWFEIPAADLDRACRFYETVLATSLNRGQFGPETLAVFPYEKPAVSGCLCQLPEQQPERERHGGLPQCRPRSGRRPGRVEPAGGKVSRSENGDAARHGTLCAHPGHRGQCGRPARDKLTMCGAPTGCFKSSSTCGGGDSLPPPNWLAGCRFPNGRFIAMCATSRSPACRWRARPVWDTA